MGHLSLVAKLTMAIAVSAALGSACVVMAVVEGGGSIGFDWLRTGLIIFLAGGWATTAIWFCARLRRLEARVQQLRVDADAGLGYAILTGKLPGPRPPAKSNDRATRDV